MLLSFPCSLFFAAAPLIVSDGATIYTTLKTFVGKYKQLYTFMDCGMSSAVAGGCYAYFLWIQRALKPIQQPEPVNALPVG